MPPPDATLMLPSRALAATLTTRLDRAARTAAPYVCAAALVLAVLPLPGPADWRPLDD